MTFFSKIFFTTSFLFFSQLCLAEAGPYHVDHRISLSGGEGWDALSIDPSTDRLFVTRGNHIDVIDLKTEKSVGQISGGIDGAHAVGFLPGKHKGYITSGKTAKVIVVDTATLKILKEIPVGKKPDLLLFEETTSRLFVFNVEDPSISVIDPSTDQVIKTIPIEGSPEFAVADQGTIYLNNEDKSSIQVIDAKEMSLKKTWPLKGCKAPTGIAADFLNRRLFSACDNEVLAVTNADSGQSVTNLTIGKGPDGAGFDQGLIFSSNGSGTLTVIREKGPASFEVIQNLSTQKGARTMTVDPKTHQIYLVASKYLPVPAETPKARPQIVAGSVEILVLKKDK